MKSREVELQKQMNYLRRRIEKLEARAPAISRAVASALLYTGWMSFPGITAIWGAHYNRASNTVPNMLPPALPLSNIGVGRASSPSPPISFWGFTPNDYLFINHTAALAFQGGEAGAAEDGFAIGGWFLHDNAGNWGTGRIGLVNKWGASGDYSYAIEITSSKYVRFSISSNGTAVNYVEIPTALEHSKWYFICGSWRQSSGNVDIFVNGTYDLDTGYSSIFNSTAAFRVGRMDTDFFDGKIAGVFASGLYVWEAIINDYYRATKNIFGSLLGDPP